MSLEKVCISLAKQGVVVIDYVVQVQPGPFNSTRKTVVSTKDELRPRITEFDTTHVSGYWPAHKAKDRIGMTTNIPQKKFRVKYTLKGFQFGGGSGSGCFAIRRYYFENMRPQALRREDKDIGQRLMSARKTPECVSPPIA